MWPWKHGKEGSARSLNDHSRITRLAMLQHTPNQHRLHASLQVSIESRPRSLLNISTQGRTRQRGPVMRNTI